MEPRRVPHIRDLPPKSAHVIYDEAFHSKEDRATLESDPSAVAGVYADGQEQQCSALSFLPIRYTVSDKLILP